MAAKCQRSRNISKVAERPLSVGGDGLKLASSRG